MNILQARGVEVSDILPVKENNGQNEMVHDLMEVFFHHRLFTPPHKQVEIIAKLNSALWQNHHLTEEAIWSIGDCQNLWVEGQSSNDEPNRPTIHSGGIYCTTLVFDFPDPQETLLYYLQACQHVFEKALEYGKFEQEDKIPDLPEFVFAPGREPKATKPQMPAFRWVVTELGRKTHEGRKDGDQSIRPTDGSGIGLELLWIAAMHPRWAASLCERISPWPAASGVTINGMNMLLGRSDSMGNLRLLLRKYDDELNCAPLQQVGWVTEVNSQ